MDERIPGLKKGDSLPDAKDVYRVVLITERDRKNRRLPAVRCFSLSKNDNNRLSVDFATMTSGEECLSRVGCTYKMGKQEFKSFRNRAQSRKIQVDMEQVAILVERCRA